MIQLNSTSDLVQLITGSAGAVDVSTHWQDLNGDLSPPTWLPGRQNTPQITTATTTTIVPSPTTATIGSTGKGSRNCRLIMIHNTSTTQQNQVTVQTFDGTTHSPCITWNLSAGDSLHYIENGGWKYVPATTSVQVPGRLLKTTTLTTGTSFTTGPNTNTIKVRAWGAGGGGAGCTSVAAAASAGGGGGAGGYGEVVFAVSPNTAYAYAIGALGAGNSGAAGSAGGNTTFTVGSVTLTANGGSGAVVATASASLTTYAGGAGGTVGSGGTINGSGAPGEPGQTLLVATPIVASGSGGSCLAGEGGVGLAAVGAGTSGTGNGSGGGGAATGAATVRTGGSGTGGIVSVDEYS